MEQEGRGGVDIAQALALVVAPAEDVGDRAVAERDVEIGLVDHVEPLARGKAGLVDREIVAAAREQAADAQAVDVVLRGRAVGLALPVFQAQYGLETVVRTEGEGRAHQIGVTLAVLGAVEQVLVIALVPVAVEGELGAEGLRERPGDDAGQEGVQPALHRGARTPAELVGRGRVDHHLEEIRMCDGHRRAGVGEVGEDEVVVGEVVLKHPFP